MKTHKSKFIVGILVTLVQVMFAGLFIACANDTTNTNHNPQTSSSGPGTYTINAALSCYVNARGGIDFGAGQDASHPSLLVEANVVIDNDGRAMLTAKFRKSSVVIFGVQANTFIDATNSTPGYYDPDGIKQNATYTLSTTDTATNPSSEEIHYVNSITFPVDKTIAVYNLWIYVNSNVMGVQFCDGSGSGHSNQPNVATPYVGKITLDWATLTKK